MASLIFKRFFDVRLLHEYYFVQDDGTSIFDKSRDSWDDIVAEKIINKRYDIRDDLRIIPTVDCKGKLKNFNMKFAVKPTGFIVGIGVKNDLQTPKIPIEKATVFQFLVYVTNPYFRSFTNEPPKPVSYYFSNRALQLDRIRTPPVLSAAIAKFSTQKTYKMGELSLKGNKLQLARKTTSSASASDWMPLSEQGGKYTYLNGQDICRFSRKVIQYQDIEPIEKVKAELFNDASNSPLKTIDLTFDIPLQTVGLDFSVDKNGEKINDGLFKLKTSYNGKASVSEMVYFNDSLSASRPYALIEISTDGEGGFALLTDGKLVNTATGKHPIFDILMKSRATYWRYRSTNKKKLVKPDGFDFLQVKGDDLVTVDPRILSEGIASFQQTINNSNTSIFLPTPELTFLQQDNDVTYADVFVPKI